jgi:general secretion pathway protein C
MFQINNMPARVLRPNTMTALIWCLAAAGLVFWVLKFPLDSAPLHSLAASDPKDGSGSMAEADVKTARAWGVQSAQPEVSVALSSRFQLLGVIASASGQGSALISVDGQPPKAFRVGQTLTDGVTLISLSAKQANVGPTAAGVGGFSLALQGQGKAP